MEIDTRLDAMKTERRKLDDRLSFLLDNNNLEMAPSFRDEYGKQLSALIEEERSISLTGVWSQIAQWWKELAQDRPNHNIHRVIRQWC